MIAEKGPTLTMRAWGTSKGKVASLGRTPMQRPKALARPPQARSLRHPPAGSRKVEGETWATRPNMGKTAGHRCLAGPHFHGAYPLG